MIISEDRQLNSLASPAGFEDIALAKNTFESVFYYLIYLELCFSMVESSGR